MLVLFITNDTLDFFYHWKECLYITIVQTAHYGFYNEIINFELPKGNSKCFQSRYNVLSDLNFDKVVSQWIGNTEKWSEILLPHIGQGAICTVSLFEDHPPCIRVSERVHGDDPGRWGLGRGSIVIRLLSRYRRHGGTWFSIAR